jgi:hypothetical protein
MPLSQIVSASIEDGAVAPVDLSSLAQYMGYKNKLINGSFQVWQRATTYALTGSFAYGSADRWAVAMGATAAGIANRIASDLTGFQYALKLGRNSGSTSAGPIYTNQVIENANCYDLQGQTITVSFWAKAGANYSASGSALGLAVNTGTGTDSTSLSATFGGWTGNANPYAGNTTITTTWTRYSITCTLGSTVTNVGILFTFIPTGTAGADDNVYLTGIQLEKGSVATSFDYRPYGTELQLCQRYCYVIGGGSSAALSSGAMYTTTVAYFPIPLPVQTRVFPTGLIITGTYICYATSNAYNVTSLQIGGSSVSCCEINGTVSGAVAGQANFLRVNAAGQIQFTGMEL